jgi:hypothetical protein
LALSKYACILSRCSWVLLAFFFRFFCWPGTWLSKGLADGAVAGFFIGVAPTGVQASAHPSARLPSAHVTGM